nr:hypothetical protein [Klebsiella michiganensis]
MARVDNVYHRIGSVDKENQLITLMDGEGKNGLFHPGEALAEGVTLYREQEITVSQGDKMRFSKSDTERGYVANSVWEVKSVSGDSVTLSDGKTTRTLNPKADQAQQHVDLAYAITAHGAQGPVNRLPSHWRAWRVVGNGWPALNPPMSGYHV